MKVSPAALDQVYGKSFNGKAPNGGSAGNETLHFLDDAQDSSTVPAQSEEHRRLSSKPSFRSEGLSSSATSVSKRPNNGLYRQVCRKKSGTSEELLPHSHSELERWSSKVPGRGAVFNSQKVKEDVRRCLEKPDYNVTSLYHKTGLWQKIARNPTFENITLLVISINAIWMAIDTDYNGATSLVEAQPLFQIVEHFFCVYFSFEWVARFMSFEVKRDGLHDAWFVFDSMLVFFMVTETWVMSALLLLGGGGGGGPLGNASILRLLRLLRLSRLARMLRTMPELMIMIKGMVAATRSVIFTLLLLVVIMYVFAIMFTQLASGTAIEATFFPSIPGSMFTLLVTGTFLDDLTHVVNHLGAAGFQFPTLFFAFILLSALTVLNMLIGVLCEVVSAVAVVEKEEMLLAFIRSKMKQIVDEIDHDGDHRISKTEFGLILEKPDAIAALQEVGVDPSALVDFADYIFVDEEDDDKDLSLGDFLEVILQFRGSNSATMKDMIDLRRFLADRFRIAEDRLVGLKPLRGSKRSSIGKPDMREGSFDSPMRPSVCSPSLLAGRRFTGSASPRPHEAPPLKPLDLRRATRALESHLSSMVEELRALEARSQHAVATSEIGRPNGIVGRVGAVPVSPEPVAAEPFLRRQSPDVDETPQNGCFSPSRRGGGGRMDSSLDFEDSDADSPPPKAPRGFPAQLPSLPQAAEQACVTWSSSDVGQAEQLQNHRRRGAVRLEDFVDGVLHECQELRRRLPLGLPRNSTAWGSPRRVDHEASPRPMFTHRAGNDRFDPTNELDWKLVRDIRVWLARLEVAVLTLGRAEHERLKNEQSAAASGSLELLTEDLQERLAKLRQLREHFM